jgi:putative transposase
MQEMPKSTHHPKWDCKYHVVFVPKNRQVVLYRGLRKHLGEIFHLLAEQKGCRIGEGHLFGNHVYMHISIPPKHAVAQVVGFIKAKSAVYLARRFGEGKPDFTPHHFWARGLYVSTVGKDEHVWRRYIRTQHEKDTRFERSKMFKE